MTPDPSRSKEQDPPRNDRDDEEQTPPPESERDVPEEAPPPEDETVPEPEPDPQVLADRLDRLESELAALNQEHEETQQRWLRSRADYDNLKRRTDREREDIRKTAAARLIGELLPQIEILDRAARELAEVDPAHAKGVQMAVAGLRRALEQEGLQEVPGQGEAFDPSLHEAVVREAADAEAGTITEVVRAGYTLHDRLLQPALVKVSAGPEEPGASSEEE